MVAREEGPGHDFFDHSDPHVARLEVRWDDPAPETDRGHHTQPAGGTVMSDETVAEGAAPAKKGLLRRTLSIPQRIQALEAEVQENRRLNRRIAELTDVVAELLVPIADRDEDKVRELLAGYRKTTLAP